MRFLIDRASTTHQNLNPPHPAAIIIPYHPDWDDEHPESVYYAYAIELNTLEDAMQLANEVGHDLIFGHTTTLIDTEKPVTVLFRDGPVVIQPGEWWPLITVYDDYL